MNTAFPLFFIPPVAILLYAFWAIDWLIVYERQNHPDEWIADGKPPGMFWWSANGEETVSANLLKNLTSNFMPSRGFSQFRVSFLWLFKTPDWITSDVNARKVLSKFRWSVLIWNIGVLAFAIWFVGFYT